MKIIKRSAALLVCLAACLAASAQGQASSQSTTEECAIHDLAIAPLSARPDAAFDELFTRFGPGWTGGDSSYSLPLPDGRVLWLFSDTFLGFVNPSRTRPRNAPMVNSTLVVQDGEEMTTLTQMIGTLPQSFFPSPEEGSWYWVYDATVEQTPDGDVVRVFLIRFERSGDGGMWGFRWVDNALATLSLPELALQGIEPMPSDHGVSWGAALLETDEHIYVYGTEDLGDHKYMHLARAPRHRLTDTAAWTYASDAAGGWSTDPTDSVRLHEGVANEYSVTEVAGGYLLVTMDARTPLSPDLYAFRACDPQGPFEDGVLLYVTPESDGAIGFTYNAHAHPQFTQDGELLISYNLNAYDIAHLFADADLYRPRFVRVRLGEP